MIKWQPLMAAFYVYRLSSNRRSTVSRVKAHQPYYLYVPIRSDESLVLVIEYAAAAQAAGVEGNTLLLRGADNVYYGGNDQVTVMEKGTTVEIQM